VSGEQTFSLRLIVAAGRDEEFRKMNIKLVVDAGMHSMVINLLPKFCQP
jgi:hypothetical protein